MSDAERLVISLRNLSEWLSTRRPHAVPVVNGAADILAALAKDRLSALPGSEK